MKIYCRKEMLHPVIRFKDQKWNPGSKYDKSEIKEWFDLPDSPEAKKIMIRYKLACIEFSEALYDFSALLSLCKNGRD